jgi:uncharacterized protein (TIGR02453 family)
MGEREFFRPELFDFLRQLKRHNNREWFARNKARYEAIIRDPALHFIADFAPHLRKINSHFVADPHPTRGSLFRIYRDTRFSADKKPYKIHIGIRFLHAGGKDIHAPVFYLHLEPGSCFVAAGVWHPERIALNQIRTAIVADPKGWAAVRRKVELGGESLKRPPRGFDPNHSMIEDLKRKDFIAAVDLTEAEICGPNLMREFTAGCRKMLPLVEFTSKALGAAF